MNTQRSILVIDSSPESRKLYSEYLRGTPYHIIESASDGADGLGKIRRLEPDIVILEMILPQMDGLEVLQQVASDRKLVKKPLTLVISSVARGDIVAQAFSTGAGYYMLKPFSRELLLRRLAGLCEKRGSMPVQFSGSAEEYAERICDGSDSSLERMTTQFLRDAAVPPHIRGYQYLRDSIMIVAQKKENINSVTKLLYPLVGKMNHTSSGCVERAIRHAIEITFRNQHTPLLEKLFSYLKANEKEKPTSAEFIAVAADYIRMREGKDYKYY